ncbi:MAG: thiamine phosphate synthase [Gammaproteobacteria bacterium]
MPITFPPSGLYVISDARLQSPEHLCRQVRLAIEGGAMVVQYRDKSQDQERRVLEADALLQLCHAHSIPLIINDDIELAMAIQADGLHIGREDTDLQLARQRLGPDAIIGVSCYNEWNRATAAVNNGANYIAFGRFFESTTKPDTTQATLGLLERAHSELSVPIVAIGGITPENGATLIHAGADCLAVIAGVFAQPDVLAAARQYKLLFNSR